jgi:Hsp70 protein
VRRRVREAGRRQLSLQLSLRCVRTRARSTHGHSRGAPCAPACPKTALDDSKTIKSYKSLSLVEHAIRSIKTVDLHVRPVYHWLEDRVRAHVFLRMLAYYLEWHMRQRLAPMLYTTTPTRRPPRRSPRARSQRLSDRPTPSPSRPQAEPTMVSPSTACEAARNQHILHPERTVRSIKRLMGSDRKVSLDGRDYTPQDILAMILRRLKEIAEIRLGQPVRKAVITVPAFFSDAQRQATREAERLPSRPDRS